MTFDPEELQRQREQLQEKAMERALDQELIEEFEQQRHRREEREDNGDPGRFKQESYQRRFRGKKCLKSIAMSWAKRVEKTLSD